MLALGYEITDFVGERRKAVSLEGPLLLAGFMSMHYFQNWINDAKPTLMSRAAIAPFPFPGRSPTVNMAESSMATSF